MADTDVAKIGVKLTVDGAEEAGKKIDDVGKKGKKTEGSLKDLSKSANKTGGPFRAMRGSMQQVSWQLQDVAVQSQMGTDKLMILGQQGPQLASVFGPGGAVVGALIAFGSVLAGVVINSLGGTSQELKALEEQTKQNANAFDDLTEAQQGAIRIDTIKKIEAQKKLLKEFNKELETARRKGPKLDVIAQEGGPSIDISETEEEFANRLVAIQAKADTANQMIGLYQDSIDDLRTDTEKLIDKLKEQERVTAKTTEQIIKSSEAYEKATPKQKEEILLRAQNVETLKREKLAKDEAIAVDKKAAEEKALFIANLDKQHNLMKLTGEDLYIYQANQAGATDTDRDAIVAKIRLNAETKEEIRLAAEAAKKKKKADADALKQGDKAQQLMEDIQQANMTELEQLKAHLDKKGGLLFQHLEEGHITLDQYLAMDAELQKTYDLAEVEAKQDLADKLAEIEAKRLEDNKTYLQEWFEQTEETLMSIDAMSVSVAEGMESGFAESFGSFLKGTATAEEAMKGLVVSVGQNMAQMIADMIAQWMAYHIMQSIMGKTTQASEATAMSLNAVAMSQMAGLAAFASTAAIPIVGPAAAPAAMMAALAITTPVAAGISALSAMAVGARAQGGQVRGGESYLVGERGPELLTMGTSGRIATNENLKNAVGGDNGNTSNVVNVNFSVQANDTAGFDRLLQSRRGQIVGMINQAVNNRGRASIV